MGQPMGQYGAGRPRLGFPSVLLAALLESEASRNPVRPVRHGLELPIEAGRSTDGLFTDRFLGARRQGHDLLAKIVQFLQHGLVGGWFGKRRQFLDAGTTDLYHLTERVRRGLEITAHNFPPKLVAERVDLGVVLAADCVRLLDVLRLGEPLRRSGRGDRHNLGRIVVPTAATGSGDRRDQRKAEVESKPLDMPTLTPVPGPGKQP
jgi:hypothetical protein